MSAFLILGLDIALGSTGWAHVDYEDGALIASGLIKPNDRDELEDRIHHIAMEIDLKVTESVSNVFIEAGIVHRSRTTSLHLARLRGGVDERIHGLAPVNEVNITKLKAWATSDGHASKEQMIAEANRRFGVWLTDDEADAGLIALWGREQILQAIAEHPGGAA